MIEIEHLGPFTNDDVSPAKYKVRIKGREICTFQHCPADGLGKCLQRAAVAFEESEAERLKAEVSIEPRNLRPFVKRLWEGHDSLTLRFRVNDPEGSASASHEENHHCGDIEGFLRCLAEMKERGILSSELIIHDKAKDFKYRGAKGDWVFEESSGYAGYRCKKCGKWEYLDKELRCDCDITEVENEV